MLYLEFLNCLQIYLAIIFVFVPDNQLGINKDLMYDAVDEELQLLLVCLLLLHLVDAVISQEPRFVFGVSIA